MYVQTEDTVFIVNICIIECKEKILKKRNEENFSANLFIELENGSNFMNIRERKIKIKKI